MSTVHQTLTVRFIIKKYLESRRCVYNCFVDYAKAFRSVWHDGLWTVLHSFRVPVKLITLLQNLHAKSDLESKSLGSQINDCSAEMSKNPPGGLGMLKTLEQQTKLDVLVSHVFSCLLYAAETQPIKVADSRKLVAF